MESILQYALSPFPKRKLGKKKSSTFEAPQSTDHTRILRLESRATKSRQLLPGDATPSASRRSFAKWDDPSSDKLQDTLIKNLALTPSLLRKKLGSKLASFHSIEASWTASVVSKRISSENNTSETGIIFPRHQEQAHIIHLGDANIANKSFRRITQHRSSTFRDFPARQAWSCLPQWPSRNGRNNDVRKMQINRMSFIPEPVRGTNTITLWKDNGTFGLVIAEAASEITRNLEKIEEMMTFVMLVGPTRDHLLPATPLLPTFGVTIVLLVYNFVLKCGIDKGRRARIAALRPGSPALRSDSLNVGDYIVAVDRVKTENLSHDQIVSLLKVAENKVQLEVEYEVPDLQAPSSGGAQTRRVDILLEKDGGSLGFTVRGGMSPDMEKKRPLVVTNVRSGGPADREGTIKAGDRLIAMDGLNLTDRSVGEVQEALRKAGPTVSLTVEYDVSDMQAVRSSGVALCVEVEQVPGVPLGVTFCSSPSSAHGGEIVIEKIHTASIAERCGVLFEGDTILKINGTEVSQLTVAEATQLLRTATPPQLSMEILPRFKLSGSLVPFKGKTLPSPYKYGSILQDDSLCGAIYNSLDTQVYPTLKRRLRSSPDIGPTICHVEGLEISVPVEVRGCGIALSPPSLFSDWPIVASIEPDSPADRCGVINPGDRVLSVNGQNAADVSISELVQKINNSRPNVSLRIEFDVADSVIPSSGNFTVKLPCRANGLGITVAAGRPADSLPTSYEPILINDVAKGSSAHRSGTLQPGDRLLAIDFVRLDHHTAEEGQSMLRSANGVIALKVQKDDLFSGDNGLVMYTVELERHEGPLGITISGSQEPFDPILIAGITPGGLADKTGAIHVGDRLLGINGVSLRGKPLSEAVNMLQNNRPSVLLKVARPAENNNCDQWRHLHDGDCQKQHFWSFPALPSVDSAVGSYDSTGVDQIYECSPRKSDGSGKHSLSKFDDCEENMTKNGGDLINSRSPSRSSKHSDENQEWDKMIEDLNYLSQECASRRKTLLSDASSTADAFGVETETIPPCESLAQRWRNIARMKSLDEGLYSVVDAAASSFAQPFSAGNSQSSDSATCGDQHIFQVTLSKDSVYEDFGFSVSDGLYEKGVYINRIRKGGPADRSCLLQPYDRILKVNETHTYEFDCCLTVPLIASASERLVLLVSRNNKGSKLEAYFSSREELGSLDQQDTSKDSENSTSLPNLA